MLTNVALVVIPVEGLLCNDHIHDNHNELNAFKNGFCSLKLIVFDNVFF